MAAAMNGMALHGGFIPAGATFLVFTDYARPAMRIAALAGIPVVYVMTHDSIGLGEDGPTHQPVEHLGGAPRHAEHAVFRPADAIETAECWQLALERTDGPTRAGADPPESAAGPHGRRRRQPLRRRRLRGVAGRRQGPGDLFASGSEVEIALDAQKILQPRGLPARVVSVPSLDLFLAQPGRRRPHIGEPVKVAVEAAVRFGWDALIGQDGIFVGMSGFGASAPTRTSTATSASPPRRWPSGSCGRTTSEAQSLRARLAPTKKERDMTVKVAINGFGRIGRNILRAIVEAAAPTSRWWRERPRAGRDQRASPALRLGPRPIPERGEGRRGRAWSVDGARSR